MDVVLIIITVILLFSGCMVWMSSSQYDNWGKIGKRMMAAGASISLWLIVAYHYAEFPLVSEGPYTIYTHKDKNSFQFIIENNEVVNLTKNLGYIVPDGSTLFKSHRDGTWSLGIYFIVPTRYTTKIVEIEKR